MKETQIAEDFCSVARTIGAIGDAWTLLLLRELFVGTRRFEDFQAYTGMAPKLLSSRLSRLEREGIVHRVLYQERPLRYETRLTEKGLDLYSIVVSMASWGDRWQQDAHRELPARRLHKKCGLHFNPVLTCSCCGEALTAREVRLEMGADLLGERKRRRDRLNRALGRNRASAD